jgi:hypothetical protein
MIVMLENIFAVSVWIRRFIYVKYHDINIGIAFSSLSFFIFSFNVNVPKIVRSVYRDGKEILGFAQMLSSF